jgi:hypothetical protein
MSEKNTEEKKESIWSSTICQVCGEEVKSVYHNSRTNKTGHKRCI